MQRLVNAYSETLTLTLMLTLTLVREHTVLCQVVGCTPEPRQGGCEGSLDGPDSEVSGPSEAYP